MAKSLSSRIAFPLLCYVSLPLSTSFTQSALTLSPAVAQPSLKGCRTQLKGFITQGGDSSIMTIPDSGLMKEKGASCLPCTPEEEKKIVTDLRNECERYLKEDNLYFVISSSWFRRWERYVGIDADENLIGNLSSDSRHVNGAASSVVAERPGPIDNSDIVENGSDSDCKENGIQVRRMLMEGQDYVLVPQGVWEKLLLWQCFTSYNFLHCYLACTCFGHDFSSYQTI